MKITSKNSKYAFISLLYAILNTQCAIAGAPWFSAEFNEAASNLNYSSASELGWQIDTGSESYFESNQLNVENETVAFNGGECIADKSGCMMTVDTTMLNDGYDELPAAPSIKEGVKAAIAPVFNGNYFVLGCDDCESANHWIDTGIPAVCDREVKVSVTFLYTNAQHSAIYSFDGNATDPIHVYSGSIQCCDFVGSGSVSKLAGEYDYGAPTVDVSMPTPAGDGLGAYIEGRRANEANPGETVTVVFVPQQKYPTRYFAKYEVQEDGSMVFADEGSQPLARYTAAINDTHFARYFDVGEAIRSAGDGDLVVLTGAPTVGLDGTAVFDGHCILDFCGCSIDDYNWVNLYFTTDTPSLVLNSDNIINSCYSECWINVETVINVSIDFAEKCINLVQAKLGKAGVEVVVSKPIADCSSAVDGYLVDESVREDGCHVYRLVKDPEAVQSEPESELPAFVSACPAEIRTRYTTWASANLASGEVANEAAYLLDCTASEVAEEAAKFKVESIGVENGEVVVKVTGGKTDGERYCNGYVKIVEVELPGNSGARFYKAELVAAPQ